MTKQLLTLITALTFGGLSAIAQPTLTGAGINPTPGDVLTVQVSSGSGFAPGNSGANQTWDISGFVAGNSGTSIAVLPSSTPFSSSFPAATVAASNGGGVAYAYYAGSSSVLSNLGVAQTGAMMVYSNPEDLLHFPFTYNNTFSDTWATLLDDGSGDYIYRRGTTTVTADGYGTLITPEGTITDVLRVHFVQVYQDSLDLGGTPFILNYNNDEYMWYKNGVHGTVATTYTLTSTAGNSAGGTYITGLVGVNEVSALISSEVSPNPATDMISIDFTLSENKTSSVAIYNSLGQVVMTAEPMNAQRGLNNMKLDVSALPAGIYFSTVLVDGKPSGSRRFTVSK